MCWECNNYWGIWSEIVEDVCWSLSLEKGSIESWEATRTNMASSTSLLANETFVRELELLWVFQIYFYNDMEIAYTLSFFYLKTLNP